MSQFYFGPTVIVRLPAVFSAKTSFGVISVTCIKVVAEFISPGSVPYNLTE